MIITGCIMIFIYSPAEQKFLSKVSSSITQRDEFYDTYNYTRYSSLTMGLTYCILTNKIIVFCMARMSYAFVQIDAVIFGIFASLISYDISQEDGYLTPFTLSLAWKISATICLIRFLWWTVIAMNQIATKLNINI